MPSAAAERKIAPRTAVHRAEHAAREGKACELFQHLRLCCIDRHVRAVRKECFVYGKLCASGKERNRFISGIQRTLDDTRTLRKKKAWLRFIIVQ